MSSTEENPSREDAPPRPVVPGYQIESFAGSFPGIERWDAVQTSLDRRVVLLTLKSSLVGDPARVAHFEEVARVVARLGHRGFVQVIDIARTDAGLPYVVTETIDGRTLADAVREDGPFAPEAAAKIVLQLADALDAAWKQAGFVHRNVKPDNVYLLPDGSAKIGSFLFATIARSVANPLAADDGLLAGTPNYMPPEQVDRVRSIDFHADIYSTGALFWQALTGRVPFGEESDPARVVELQKEGVLPAPSDLDPAVPVPFSRIVQKMMAKRPSDRYGFWQDVVEDIQRAQAGRDLFVPGGGAWVAPRSTVADPAPAPAPGKPRIRVSASTRAAAAAAAAPASRIRIGAARKAAVAPQSPLRTASPIRAGSAETPAPAAPAPAPGVSLPRIAVTPVAPFAPSDGGTRRSAPVAAAPSDGGTRRSAPVAASPAAGGTRRSAPVAAAPAGSAGAVKQAARPSDEPSAAAAALDALLVKKPPMLVRLVGTVLFVFTLLFTMWLRIGKIENGAAPSASGPVSVVRTVAPRVGKAIQVARPVASTVIERPAPAEPVAAAPAAEEAPAAPAAAPEAAAPDDSKRLPMDLYEDAIFHLVRDLRRKTWTEAKRTGERAMADVASKLPERRDECNRVLAALRASSSWEDLVGAVLWESPHQREITIGKTKHVIVPTGVTPGYILCDRIVNGQTLNNQKLPLEKMSSRDKWAIVKSSPAPSETAHLYSRAFMLLAFAPEKDFRSFVSKHPEISSMSGLALVYELDRK